MKQLAALLLALALGPCQPVFAAGEQWECLDASGQKTVQDHPCPRRNPEFRAEAVPSYVWAIIAVLGLVWVKALLPERMFRRGGTASRMPPLLVADGPPMGDAPRPQPGARPAASKPAAARPVPASAPAQKPVTAPATWSLDRVSSLESLKFALLVQGFWRARSCTVDFAGQSSGGADLMIYRPSTGRLFAIAQCASMRTGTVGIERVQQLWELVEKKQAALGLHYGAAFSPEAQAFVKNRRLKLIAAADFLHEIQALPADQQQSLLASITRGI